MTRGNYTRPADMMRRAQLFFMLVGSILATIALIRSSHFLWQRDVKTSTRLLALRYCPRLGLCSKKSLKVPFPTKIAYCQYVTDRDYLCNSLMIFESLSISGSQADLLLMYPQHWNLDPSSIEGHWLRKAREEYGVKLAPIQIQHFEGEHTWADSFTKLLAFNQTQYERVISLDSDANVLGVCSEVQEDVLALRLTHLLAYG